MPVFVAIKKEYNELAELSKDLSKRKAKRFIYKFQNTFVLNILHNILPVHQYISLYLQGCNYL